MAWINSTLGLQYTKVEQVRSQICLQVLAYSVINQLTRTALQTHNGAVACQIMDALHHGVVPMGKVTHPPNFAAFESMVEKRHEHLTFE